MPVCRSASGCRCHDARWRRQAPPRSPRASRCTAADLARRAAPPRSSPRSLRCARLPSPRLRCVPFPLDLTPGSLALARCLASRTRAKAQRVWLRRPDVRAPAPPQTWHLLGLEKAAQVALSQEAADGAQGRVEGKPLPGLAPRLILALARMHCSGPTALRLESRFGAAGAADAASPSFRPVLTADASPRPPSSPQARCSPQGRPSTGGRWRR